jgi:hypothetical protein
VVRHTTSVTSFTHVHLVFGTIELMSTSDTKNRGGNWQCRPSIYCQKSMMRMMLAVSGARHATPSQVTGLLPVQDLHTCDGPLPSAGCYCVR